MICRRLHLVIALLLPLVVNGAEHMHEPAPAMQSKPVKAGDLTISGAWARATVPGLDTTAAYLTIRNHGKQADTLLGVTSPAAGMAAIHRTTRQAGVSHMEPAGDVGIAAGQTVDIEPGGLHIMLTSLKQPLAAGTQMPLTLHFRHAGAVTVQVQIVPVTAAAPADMDHDISVRDHSARGAPP